MQSFPKFFLDTQEDWGWVETLDDLKRKFTIYKKQSNCLDLEFIDFLIKCKESNYEKEFTNTFALRSEHQGNTITLYQFLLDEGVLEIAFTCQTHVESNCICSKQCDHCKQYYSNKDK